MLLKEYAAEPEICVRNKVENIVIWSYYTLTRTRNYLILI